MVVVLYISGHGFGHASRSVELAAAIHARRPDARIVVRTSVPLPFLERSRRSPFDIEPCETDTGVVQVDSLHIDEAATIRDAARFYATFDARVAAEAAHLRQLGASLVVGDVPPLAFAAAARAGIPSVAVANFTWDWIYGHYPAFARDAPSVVATIAAGYAEAALALRLPLHGGFAPMARVTRDIPFIARRSNRARDDVRRRIGVDGRTAVLASFGAYGVDAPFQAFAGANGVALIEESWLGQFRYEDLVAASDVVISKPGYGIVSECAANGAALLYTSRDRFIEYDVFVEEMPRYLRCLHIPQDDLLGGRWAGAIATLLAQPTPPAPEVSGADAAARAILELAGARTP